MSTNHTIGHSSKSLLPLAYNNNACFQQARDKAITCDHHMFPKFPHMTVTHQIDEETSLTIQFRLYLGPILNSIA